MGQLGGGLGMDPAALEKQRRMAAEMEAGSRENGLLRMQQSASAKGFGNSMGLVDAEGRLRAGSAANLQNTYDRLFVQEQMMNQQAKQAAAQIYAQMQGLEAGNQGLAAQLMVGRSFPAIPGYTPPPEGGAYEGNSTPGWSQSGRYMPGGVGYDPFAPPVTGSGAPTGYSPQQPYSPW